jgi:deazaflavin-dependent oxidoreductase (nitroreductase family)
LSDWNEKIVTEFRENKGIVGGHFAGAKLLLLTTTGAKSGLPRVHPMMYFPDGDRRIVVASKGGHPKHPAWYHNLVANPTVHVEAAVDGSIDEYDAIATPLSDDDRAVQFAKVVSTSPQFGEYQTKTERTIPLISLQRTE